MRYSLFFPEMPAKMRPSAVNLLPLLKTSFGMWKQAIRHFQKKHILCMTPCMT